jgi:hypothetical protein
MQALKQLPGWQQHGWLLLEFALAVRVLSLHLLYCVLGARVLLAVAVQLLAALCRCDSHHMDVLIQAGCVQLI